MSYNCQTRLIALAAGTPDGTSYAAWRKANVSNPIAFARNKFGPTANDHRRRAILGLEYL